MGLAKSFGWPNCRSGTLLDRLAAEFCGPDSLPLVDALHVLDLVASGSEGFAADGADVGTLVGVHRPDVDFQVGGPVVHL